MEHYQHKILKVSDLIPYALNSRDHSDLQVAQISASIREFGFTNPVLADEENNLIAGHGRVLAARKLDIDEVPAVIVTGLDERKRRALIIADNKLALNASWNDEALKVELEDLATDYGSLMGFDQDEILKLLGVEEKEGLVDDDAIPDIPEEPKSKLGDVYKLGNHRVMCGDSCVQDDVDKLMDGELADMVFTDPPWNVNYGTQGKEDGSHPSYKKRDRTILNDFMGTEDFLNFMNSAFKQLNLHSKDGCPTYVVMSAQEWGNMMLSLATNDYHWSSTIIWNKHSLVLSRKDYHTKYEPIWYGWKEGAPRLMPLKDRKQCDVWDIDRPTKSDLHPTTKPIALLEIAINNSSKPANIVLDLFGGSGSTMIACEKIGRSARLMELDPKYCDVIVQRWEDFTGEKAELLK